MVSGAVRARVLVVLLASACSGDLLTPAGPGGGNAGSSDGAGGGDDHGGPLDPGCAAQPLEARLLAADEVRHTVSDLLGISALELDDVQGFDGPVLEQIGIDDLTAERIALSADKLAALAVEHLDDLALCGWQESDGSLARGVACDPAELVESLGSRAYRRPLTAGEAAALLALYQAGVAEDGAGEGVTWLL